ncbi:MAG: peroxiredoxin-like family protein, partial [Saprospiraceae bacterium]
LLACNTTPQAEPKVETTPEVQETPKVNLGDFGVAETSFDKVKAVNLGEIAPDFTGKNQFGKEVTLSKELEKGDVVLIFYRGYWCPYCTRYLGEYVARMDEIKAKGASIIAIAPEGEQYTKKSAEISGLDVPFISDSKNEILGKYGVAFEVNDAYNEKFNNWKKGETSIGEINDQETAFLPIPATYIIGKDGKVKWVHFDPDYSKRASVEEVIKNL